MKKIFFLSFCFLVSVVNAQSNLPVNELPGNNRKPFVLYLSGDGGFNNFSTSLNNFINTKGYEITALNCRSYFWNKKNPQQAANDLSAYLRKKLSGRPNQQIVMIGYSFGADVLAFIVNRFPDDLKDKLLSNIFLAPSSSTDFEIHLNDMLGLGSRTGSDVLKEINEMGLHKVTIIQSSNDGDFKIQNVRLKNFKSLKLAGNHHFDKNINELATIIIENF